MRLEKIQTAQQAQAKPTVAKVAEGYAVRAVNNKEVKVSSSSSLLFGLA